MAQGGSDLEDEEAGYVDSDDMIPAGPTAQIFMQQPGPEPAVSSEQALAYHSAPPLQLPANQVFPPEVSTPTDYPMLNTSLPAAFSGHVSAEVSPMDDRRGSGQTEASAQDILYQLASDSANLSPREKREFMAMYGPPFGPAPTSRPALSPHQQQWPNVETHIARSTPSLQTSPTTAASEMPPTPTDYRLLQRPKSGVPTEQFMRPDLNGPQMEQGLVQPPQMTHHGLPQQPPRCQPLPPRSAPPQQQQQQAPPPQVQFAYSMPQQQPPPPPQPSHWQPPELVTQLEMYEAPERYTPVDAGTVREMGPTMQQFAWVNGGSTNYDFMFGDDKGPDTFGDQLPSQALGY